MYLLLTLNIYFPKWITQTYSAICKEELPRIAFHVKTSYLICFKWLVSIWNATLVWNKSNESNGAKMFSFALSYFPFYNKRGLIFQNL